MKRIEARSRLDGIEEVALKSPRCDVVGMMGGSLESLPF